MGLIELVLLLAIVGFCLYLLLTYVPMPEPFKKAVIVIVVIILVLYLMRLLGLGDIPIGRVR